MAICEYPILVIFGQFWLFRAHFGPRVSKTYLLQLFRCKKNNEINKSGSKSLLGKLDSLGDSKPTIHPKMPLEDFRKSKIGINECLLVQLTGLGPQKTNSNRSPPTSVPLTRNQPGSLWSMVHSGLILNHFLPPPRPELTDQGNC